MARPLRIELEDGLYHVVSRGNARKPVFFDQMDYERRLDWIRRTVETYGWHVHAFCLMPNHDHLFVETPRPNLAAGMHYLNGSYTSYFNRRHRRVGHLLQGRYKAVLIENEGHYWEVSRYIHLNPVRARRVERPEQWAWSSYGGYHSKRRCLPWVTYRRVLGEFGRDEITARRKYRQFVAEGMDGKVDSPFEEVVHGLLLGSQEFIDRVRSLIDLRPDDRGVPMLRRMRDVPGLPTVVEMVGRAFGRDDELWRRGRRDDSMARAAAAYLARVRFGHPAGEIARALGYAGPSSVTRAVRRVESDLCRLARQLERIERACTNH